MTDNVTDLLSLYWLIEHILNIKMCIKIFGIVPAIRKKKYDQVDEARDTHVIFTLKQLI